uniref:Uncharacterized protein n=1 Tax=Cacopsylla melanoneura TaxID=428564 RepID=A0A8D8VXA7_9HEMI
MLGCMQLNSIFLPTGGRLRMALYFTSEKSWLFLMTNHGLNFLNEPGCQYVSHIKVYFLNFTLFYFNFFHSCHFFLYFHLLNTLLRSLNGFFNFLNIHFSFLFLPNFLFLNYTYIFFFNIIRHRFFNFFLDFR